MINKCSFLSKPIFYAILSIAGGLLCFLSNLNAQNPDISSAQNIRTDSALAEPLPPIADAELGIRKIYAPDSQIRRWPLGGKKYMFLNAQKYENALSRWKLKNSMADSLTPNNSIDAFVSQALFEGKLSESGILDGVAAWKVKVNPFVEDKDNQDSSATGYCLILPTLKMGVSNFVFLPDANSKQKNDSEQKNDSKEDKKSENLSVEPVLSGCTPLGQTAIIVPSDGTLYCRWTARIVNKDDFKFLIQSPPSVETVWQIDIPENLKMALYSPEDDSVLRCAAVEKIPNNSPALVLLPFSEQEEKELSDNTVQDNSAPVNTTPDNTVPGNTTPVNTVPDNTVPNNSASDNSGAVASDSSKENAPNTVVNNSSDSTAVNTVKAVRTIYNRWQIRWSGIDQALLSVRSNKEKDNRVDCPYRQQTTYYFSPYQVRTRCKITFFPGQTTSLPREIPFQTTHDSHSIWEASLDGQAAEIRMTDNGYTIVLGKLQPKSTQPVLEISSSSNLENLLGTEGLFPESDVKVEFTLPRVQLLVGQWQEGQAIFFTQQMPLMINPGEGSIISAEMDSRRRYNTVVELSQQQNDVAITFRPFQEQLFSQDETSVQWDGSQVSLVDRFYLWSEQGGRHMLSAPIPDQLTIDHVEFLENADIFEDWEIQSPSEASNTRKLVIYLRESIRSDRPLSIEIRSHYITSWDTPIALSELQPIQFEGFQPHSQTLFVRVPSNQRFFVANRLLYSQTGMINLFDDQQQRLPNGIERTPLLSDEGVLDTRAVVGAEFRIDLQKWGDYQAKLEPADDGFSLLANINISFRENTVEEQINLNFTGDCSRLSRFKFEYNSQGNSGQATGKTDMPWHGTLISSTNQTAVEVEESSPNHFSIALPQNIAAPFTVKLNRTIAWNKTYKTFLIKPEDCRQITALVGVYCDNVRMIELHPQNLQAILSHKAESNNQLIGEFKYSLEMPSKDNNFPADDFPTSNDNSESADSASGIAEKSVLSNGNQADKSTSESAFHTSHTVDNEDLPRLLEVIRIADTKPSRLIWAWDQQVEEYHFGCGSILTTTQWTIENRFPASDLSGTNPDSNRFIHLNNITNSNTNAFLTGVWIDKTLIGGENIKMESDGQIAILLPPNKRTFTLMVQWTCTQSSLGTVNTFMPQQPVLDIPVFQSRWEVYYPSSYRRLNSFVSSDPAVDGYMQRWFGPLIRRDSESLFRLIASLWDVQNTYMYSNSPQITDNSTNATVNPQSYSLNNSIETDKFNDLQFSTFNSRLQTPNVAKTSWNCCKLSGAASANNRIRIIKNDVSESFRWTIFIIAVCIVFTIYQLKYDSEQKNAAKTWKAIVMEGFKNNRNSDSKGKTEKSDSSQPSNLTGTPNSTVKPTAENGALPASSTMLNADSFMRAPVTNRKSPAQWGFRRWLGIICILSALLAQVTPWFISITFSGLFLGLLLSLLVLAGKPFIDSNNTTRTGSSSVKIPTTVRRSTIMNLKSLLLIFALSGAFLSGTCSHVQAQKLPRNYYYQYWNANYPASDSEPATTDLSAESDSDFDLENPYSSLNISNEYQIFVPVDDHRRPLGSYYVPQNLYEKLQQVDRHSQSHPWIVCKTEFYGKLVQQLHKTEATSWKVVMEIETLSPHVSVLLPLRLRETTYSTSGITIRRGLPSYRQTVSEKESVDNSAKLTNPLESKSDSNKSSWEAIRWIWDAPRKISPQWSASEDSWYLKIAQPGRYKLEMIFHPIIKSVNGKNEISFAVLPCPHSTLEIDTSDNITGLEFPDACGKIVQIDKKFTADSALLPNSTGGEKRNIIPLSAVNQIVVRWDSGGLISGGPVMDADSLFWWKIAPGKVSLTAKYRVKVSSGEVSSLKVKADPRLILPAAYSDSRNTVVAENPNKKRAITGGKESGLKESALKEKNIDSPNSASDRTKTSVASSDNSSRKLPSGVSAVSSSIFPDNSLADAQSPISSIIQNREDTNEYTIVFKTPIRDQVSFELDFVWNQVSGVGSLQFPAITLPDVHLGRRLLAFSLDSQLQCDWTALSGLTQMSVQSFASQWGTISKPQTDARNQNLLNPSPLLPLPPPPKTENSSATQSSAEIAPKPADSGNTEMYKMIPVPIKNTDLPNTEIPTVAFDLNLSKTKTDSGDSRDLITIQTRKVTPAGQAQAEAFFLVMSNKIRWQIQWNIASTRGAYSSYDITLPESIGIMGKRFNIISAAVKTDSQNFYASVSRQDQQINVYWGKPISGNHQLILNGEILLDGETKNEIRTPFDFPLLNKINTDQYNLGLARSDEIIASIQLNSCSDDLGEFFPVELPLESPFSHRQQRNVGTWQTSADDAFHNPVGFTIVQQPNQVNATVNYTITASVENTSEIQLQGNVQLEGGILDEIVFDLPDCFGVPVSTKTTIDCQPDPHNISHNRYILRGALPLSTGTAFTLTIPLKTIVPDQWNFREIHFQNLKTGDIIVQLPIQRKNTPIRWRVNHLIPFDQDKVNNNIPAINSYDNSTAALISSLGKESSSTEKKTYKSYKADSSTFQIQGNIPPAAEQWVRIFGTSLFIKPVSESQYYAIDDFSAAVSGVESISVTLPQKTQVIDVQCAMKSVAWKTVSENTIVIPVLVQKEPQDIRIIYKSELKRTLYSEPMEFTPPVVSNALENSAVSWTIVPWKSFNKIPGSSNLHLTSIAQQEIWRMNDLLAQMRFVQSLKTSISIVTIEQFKKKFGLIERQMRENGIGQVNSDSSIDPLSNMDDDFNSDNASSVDSTSSPRLSDMDNSDPALTGDKESPTSLTASRQKSSRSGNSISTVVAIQNLRNQWQQQYFEYMNIISVLSATSATEPGTGSDTIKGSFSASYTSGRTGKTDSEPIEISRMLPGLPGQTGMATDFSLYFDIRKDNPIIAYSDTTAPIVLELNLQPSVSFSNPLLLILGSILLFIYGWLVFFPPRYVLQWRTALVLGSLGLFWLAYFNLYGIALLLLLMSAIIILRHVRRIAHREIIPLRVR